MILYLDLENIEHTRARIKSPQTNGICERFHQTLQNEFYANAFRRKIYHYNHDRTHSGKHCFGQTPMQTLKDSIPLALAKQLNRLCRRVFQSQLSRLVCQIKFRSVHF